MKLSVIVPVYNVEKYLRKCLDSLVNQTLQDIEIIVVNDGSPDNSSQIIKEYAMKYNNICSLEKENGGQASARNMALDVAKGEYIGFVDSDDWVDLEMYEEMYNIAMENQSDIVICNTIDHYKDHEVYHRQSDVGKFRKCGSVCNKIFKRSIIGNMRFPTGMWYEDFCFGIKLLMTTEKIKYTDKHFYHALTREESTMTNNNSEKNLDIIPVMQNIIDYAKEKNIYTSMEYDLEYMVIEHILITSINRVAGQKNDQKKKVIKKLREYVLSQYPNFRSSEAFQEFSKKERIIAVLNSYGLESIVRMLVYLKNKTHI